MGLKNKEIFLTYFSIIAVFKIITVLKNIILKFYYKLFPKKRRLLTEDEYTAQAIYYTRDKLRELKNFCKSTECDSWKIIDSLSSPKR